MRPSFKTRKLNEVFGRIIGFIQIFPRDYDQVMHFAHHQYTQDWERDGELVREPYTLTTYLLVAERDHLLAQPRLWHCSPCAGHYH